MDFLYCSYCPILIKAARLPGSFSVWLNNMKLPALDCFLTYKAANSKVTGALNGLSEAPRDLSMEVGRRCPDGWGVQVSSKNRCPLRSCPRQVKGSLLVCTGEGQLPACTKHTFPSVGLNGSSLASPTPRDSSGLHSSAFS